MKPNFRNENKVVNVGKGTTFVSAGNTFTLIEIGYCHLALLYKCEVLDLEFALKWQVGDRNHITEQEFLRITNRFPKKFLDPEDITIIT